jgi:nondiscriminating glutamyl-tRNA synthetase
MGVRVRFAPSPTGYLHVGGARTALYNWLFARGQAGTFVLRIEDTDAARSTDESVTAILDSLRWLGLNWDEGPDVGGPHGPYFQSQRRALYREHADQLVAAGRAYSCTCTPEELEARRAAMLERGEAPRYDGRCRRSSPEDLAARIAEGRPVAIRFALEPKGETAWEDMIRGRVAFQNEVLDDFVLLRADGLPTYNFACVVDDHAMDITHVIRGDDHISNTPRQLQMYAAFGWAPPAFAHVPMILGGDGTRLSKRHGATSVAAWRELGYLPEALDNFLALLGWSYDGTTEMFTLAELVEKFRIERVGSNPAVFNTEKLEWMNGQHLKRMPEVERVALATEFLKAHGFDLAGRDPEWIATLVRAIGDRLKTLADAVRYGTFALRDPLEVDADAWNAVREKPKVAERLGALADKIEADREFSLASLERETRALATELGIKAGELIGIARVALTGRSVSPGIFEVVWLLGRVRAVRRLREAASRWRQESPLASV